MEPRPAAYTHRQLQLVKAGEQADKATEEKRLQQRIEKSSLGDYLTTRCFGSVFAKGLTDRWTNYRSYTVMMLSIYLISRFAPAKPTRIGQMTPRPSRLLENLFSSSTGAYDQAKAWSLTKVCLRLDLDVLECNADGRSVTTKLEAVALRNHQGCEFNRCDGRDFPNCTSVNSSTQQTRTTVRLMCLAKG
jgi:hypothetical protein